MNPRISLARTQDVPAMAQMARCLVEGGLPHSWTEQRVYHCVRHDDFATIVARDGRRMSGFAILECLDEHAHLNLLAVRPAYQRQGIGRALIEWLEASARTAGIFAIRLELRARNDGARAFYRTLGYREVEWRRGYYSGLEDALGMEHDLSYVREPRA